MNTNKSEEIFKRAVKCIPGGVNSPVRAFGSVDEVPRFIKKADGTHMTDADENVYLDYICSWGPMILGHNNEEVKKSVLKACERGLSYGAATEIEVEMAEYICSRISSIDMIRMVNSGTEAVMSAIRVARGFTGRDKIIKFEGCYHGHSDALLVKAGSGVMTAGVPDSSGVPKGCVSDTLSAVYNDLSSVEKLFDENKEKVAAVIVEPVGANMGLVPPKEGFLQGLRNLCDKNGALLIFDEVITGFRLSFTGAQGMYNITPDITTYGKIIGAGMPVGAYGARREIMEMVAPVGSVYQAGTLSGNPVAMAAGLTQLKILYDNQDIYTELNKKGDYFFGEIDKIIKETNAECVCNHVGSLGSIFFTKNEVVDYDTAKTSDTTRFKSYFKHMINNNIYVAPSQFEAMFLSNSHTYEELNSTLEIIRSFFKAI